MRTKLVVGNWKMNGGLEANEALLKSVAVVAGELTGKVECAVCPPFPYLLQAQNVLRATKVAWGAQNLSQQAGGAYTGEVSAAMLLDFGCKYVIVGHSERRALYAESDRLVAEKFVAAQAAGLIPILCVGETLAEREAGATEQVVARQLDAVLELAGVAKLGAAVIAYEPVWAIGTGRTATPQQAQEVHEFIRQRIAAADRSISEQVRLLYGGSVKAGNARELMALPDVDGSLVGGASLVAEEFSAICRAAAG